jgi:hypothetical protein
MSGAAAADANSPLIARRGHKVQLISARDRHWRRDPEVGATLVPHKAR